METVLGGLTPVGNIVASLFRCACYSGALFTLGVIARAMYLGWKDWRFIERGAKKEWAGPSSACLHCGYPTLDYGPAICPECGRGWWVGTFVQPYPVADVLFWEAVREATMKRLQIET